MITGIASRTVGAGRASVQTGNRSRASHRPTRPATVPSEPASPEALPRAIRRAVGLDDICGEAIALPSPARATAAARAFSAGNGYLPGLIVDRLA